MSTLAKFLSNILYVQASQEKNSQISQDKGQNIAALLKVTSKKYFNIPFKSPRTLFTPKNIQ